MLGLEEIKHQVMEGLGELPISDVAVQCNYRFPESVKISISYKLLNYNREYIDDVFEITLAGSIIRSQAELSAVIACMGEMVGGRVEAMRVSDA